VPVHELFPVFLATLLPAALQDYKERKVTNLLIIIPFVFSFITLASLPLTQAVVTFILGSAVWLFFHGAGRRFNIGNADYPLFPAFVWAGGVTGLFVLFVFFGFWLVYDYLLMILRSFRVYSLRLEIEKYSKVPMIFLSWVLGVVFGTLIGY
jgi:Flp pilus assembly protein protease CpaA